MKKSGLARAMFGEALAYARSGLYATTGDRWVRHFERALGTGVLFVHGVGANAGQFVPMSRALRGTAHRLAAFEYRSSDRLEALLPRLERAVGEVAGDSDRVVVIGHSLGGLLLRMLLQSDAAHPRVRGFVSICAPLAGTRMARFAPYPRALERLSPKSELFRELEVTRVRLDRLAAILTVGSSHDFFVLPRTSAFLEGHPTLRLEHVGHVGSLFDQRVHTAVERLVRSVI